MCNRCNWAQTSELMKKYHDTEWGVPVHDDQKLFEFLVLEGFQAGLSWQIVLQKREAFRIAFDGFDPQKIAAYKPEKFSELLQNSSIIRNKLKISACINNAQCFINIRKEFGSFNSYIWRFTNYEPIVNSFTHINQLPAKTALSDEISADLKKRGFKFVGSTVVYAHMQATGMVNAHLTGCFRYKELTNSLWKISDNSCMV